MTESSLSWTYHAATTPQPKCRVDSGEVCDARRNWERTQHTINASFALPTEEIELLVKFDLVRWLGWYC